MKNAVLYWLFIVGMGIVTFDVPYISRNMPLIVAEPLGLSVVMTQPHQGEFRVEGLLILFFILAQLFFFVFAFREWYKKSLVLKIILSIVIIYINICLQKTQEPQDIFSQYGIYWHDLYHELSTMPLIIVSVIYLFRIWGNKSPAFQQGKIITELTNKQNEYTNEEDYSPFVYSKKIRTSLINSVV